VSTTVTNENVLTNELKTIISSNSLYNLVSLVFETLRSGQITISIVLINIGRLLEYIEEKATALYNELAGL